MLAEIRRFCCYIGVVRFASNPTCNGRLAAAPTVCKRRKSFMRHVLLFMSALFRLMNLRVPLSSDIVLRCGAIGSITDHSGFFEEVANATEESTVSAGVHCGFFIPSCGSRGRLIISQS